MALGVVREAPQRLGGRHVPEEHGAVAAGGGEAGVVGRDGEGEDFVGVCGVGLDESAFWERGREREGALVRICVVLGLSGDM